MDRAEDIPKDGKVLLEVARSQGLKPLRDEIEILKKLLLEYKEQNMTEIVGLMDVIYLKTGKVLDPTGIDFSSEIKELNSLIENRVGLLDDRKANQLCETFRHTQETLVQNYSDVLSRLQLYC